MSWKTLDDYDLAGNTVLVRVDVNVPFENGEVSDYTRIDRIAPTFQAILDKGGKPVLLAHFGRPKGEIVPEMSLAPVASAMSSRLGLDVQFCSESTGANAAAAIATLPEGSVLLLENTRFHAGEEKNDPELAKEFAALGNIYCNDAFSAAHRAHASTEAIAHLLPSCAGRLMQAELEALESALANPKPPIVTVVGGAKVSTKIELLDNLIAKVDTIIIGGGMANTFLAARGYEVGKSLCEHDLLDTARAIEDKAKAQNCALYLPSDIVVAKEFKAHAEYQILPVDKCPKDAMILDAGPKSVSEIDDIFAKTKTLIWNGPLGAFEIPPFHEATNAAAKRAAILTKQGALSSFAGGGDTVSALNQAGVAGDFTYISTAGGAFLEWLEGKTLPGVAALQSNS